jgi:uncharacterized membrane protein
LTDYIFLTLLVVHILAIVGWMGAAFVFSSVLGPSLSKMEPLARAEFVRKIIPRYTMYVIATSLIAVTFGVLLYGYAFETKILPTGTPLTLLQAGAVLGLIAFVIALGFVIPAARTMVRTMNENKSQSSSVESQTSSLSQIQFRVRAGTVAATVLLFLVLVLMVVGATA